MTLKSFASAHIFGLVFIHLKNNFKMDNQYKYEVLEFQSELQLKSIELRRLVLRKPLGLDFTENDLNSEKDQFHFGVLIDKNVVGILLLKEMKDLGTGILKMRQVAIHPNFQSKKLGSKLVEFAENWAKSNGYNLIDLHARNTAIDFYLKLGYSIEGDEFLEVNIPHHKMIKLI